jgi:sugar phosphate isomerase/epimerase
MTTHPTRRDFALTCLRTGLAGAVCTLVGAHRLGAIEPFVRPGPARFKLSLVGYSFRSYFKSADPAKRMTLFDLVDYCAVQGFAGVELTGYYFPQPATNDYLIRLKRHAHLRGVSVSGTSIGSTLGLPRGPKLDQQIAAVKAWVDAAAVLGAPYVRVFANGAKAMLVPGSLEGAIAGFEECADYAGKKGVFIGLENDGGITPDTVLAIVHGVRSPWFGLNLDLGNYHTSDVYADLVRCAPYAVNVHFKKQIREAGKPAVPANVTRMLQILRDAHYEGWLGFEYEAEEDPYQAIPPWLQQVKKEIALG